jgi:hypothetical protein
MLLDTKEMAYYGKGKNIPIIQGHQVDREDLLPQN